MYIEVTLRKLAKFIIFVSKIILFVKNSFISMINYSYRLAKYFFIKFIIRDSYLVWIGDKRESMGYQHIRVICGIIKHFLNRIKLLEETSQSIEKRPVALRNIGLNCYLNSSFQSLSACSQFVNDMKSLEQRYPSSRSLFTFNSILRLLNKNGFNQDDVELSPNKILSNWNRSGEQDTFEMLSHMIFQVFNELKKINQEKLPIKESGIQFWIKERLPMILLVEFRIQCDCGYNFKPSIQPDLALHLSVPFRVYSNSNGFTINNLLDNYFGPEFISDFNCQNCDCTDGKVSKFIVLKKPMPNTFCLHIQRSFWNQENQVMEKNNEIIFFEEKLILKKNFFCTERKCHNKPYFSTLWDICNEQNIFQSISEQNNGDSVKSNIINEFENTESVIELEKSDLDNSSPSEIKSCENHIFNVDDQKNKIDCYTASVVELNGIQDKEDDCRNDQNFIVNMENNQSEIGDTRLTDELSINEIKQDELKQNNLPLLETFRSITAQNQISDLNESEEYHLKSVIVHFGRVDSGHFICYRKCENKWFCTNDNFISEVTFSKVQSSQAYILMYEKAG